MIQNHKLSILKIDQSAFIYDLVEEEVMRDCNPIITPMKTCNFIEMQDNNYKEVDIKVYQQLIGKLMYLSCGTQPDISFVVGQLSKQNADPQAGYLKAAKQVVRYLKGTMHLGLIYGAHSQSEDKAKTKTLARQLPFGLVKYVDNNYAGNPEDRKLMMGHCFFINGAIISWCSKKQKTIYTSTTKAKYIALRYTNHENV